MRLLLLGLLLCAALPTAASAATVSLKNSQNVYIDGKIVRVAAGAGEVNRVTVTAAGNGRTATVTDTGHALVPGAGCAAGVGSSVVCTAPPPDRIQGGSVSLGDKDDILRVIVPAAAAWGELSVAGRAGTDRLDLSGARNVVDPKGGFGAASAAGGPGDDRIEGGPGDDGLEGGPGRDRLLGGGGADVVGGGAGHDVLRGGAGADGLTGGAGPDALRGGAGRDTAAYTDAHTPVRVDLAQRRARAGGTTDTLSSVEGALGGPRRDVLLGDGGPNELQGSDHLFQEKNSGDVIAGRGGADEILDFGGPSRISGGPGADRLVGIYRGDRFTCGAGRDRLDEPGPGLLLPRDCERFLTEDYAYSYPRVRHGRAVLRVRNNRGRGLGVCAATLTVASPGGRVYGTRHFRFKGTGRVRVPLNAAGRAAAAAGRVAKVTEFEHCGDTRESWRVHLSS